MSLSYLFNMGSLLGMALSLQLVSGLFLVLYYNSSNSYSSIMFIMYEVNYGWLIKMFHSNNASLIFLVLYLHLFKALKMGSYRLAYVWYSGLLMMLMIMGAAFSGYVLVGSQMSYWAAMVITSLISVIPMSGTTLMHFIWGGFGISWVTLQLLFVVHFILPFMVLFTMVGHLMFLHKSGSTSGVYTFSGVEKISFMPYFGVKDSMNLIFYFIGLPLILLYPYSMGEVELYEVSNLLNSPVHIVPEAYFLLYYAILRSVPSKGVGVLIMFMSIFILFLYPLSAGVSSPSSELMKGSWFYFLALFIFLSFLGFSPISQPFVYLSIISTVVYFMLHLIVMGVNLSVALVM